ncbi:hypothetical protein ACFX2A_030089 [Malus domestica]
MWGHLPKPFQHIKTLRHSSKSPWISFCRFLHFHFSLISPYSCLTFSIDTSFLNQCILDYLEFFVLSL